MKYSLLPFNFARFNGNVLLVNKGGDYIFLDNSDFLDFVNGTMPPSKTEYLDLKAKLFLYDTKIDLPLQLLSTQYRTKKSFLQEFTCLHMIVVSLRCNQKCKYCQVSSEGADTKKYDMSVDMAKKCVDMIFKSPSKYIKIEFQGGEPLLNFDVIKYVVKYAKKINRKLQKELEFVICTNLYMLDDKHVRFCKKEGIFVSTSLDGPASIHNVHRLSEGDDATYEKVVNNIHRIQQGVGQDKVSALMTATTASLGRFPEIIDEYLTHGFKRIFFRSINPYGMAVKHRNLVNYDIEDFVESYKEGLEYIIKLNLEGTYFVEEYARLLLKRIHTPFTTGFVDLQSPTGAVLGGAIYDYDGKVYVADEGRMLARNGDAKFMMGTVEDEYQAVFGGQVSRETVGASFVECLPECCDCAFNQWCGADPVRNYATQNDLVGYRPDNEFCLKNKGIINYLVDRYEHSTDNEKNVFWSWITGISPQDMGRFNSTELQCK